MTTKLIASASDLGMMRSVIAYHFQVESSKIEIISAAFSQSWDVLKYGIWLSDYHIVFQNNRFELLKVIEESEI